MLSIILFEGSRSHFSLVVLDWQNGIKTKAKELLIASAAAFVHKVVAKLMAADDAF